MLHDILTLLTTFNSIILGLLLGHGVSITLRRRLVPPLPIQPFQRSLLLFVHT